jgi:hypothetical protein
MATPFASDGKLGFLSTQKLTSPSQEFHLGTPMTDNLGRRWLYVQAPGAIAATTAVAVTPGAGNDTYTIAAGTGYIADSAFAAGEYGWVRLTVATAGNVTP